MFAPKLKGSSLGLDAPVNRICFRGDLRPPSEAYRVENDFDAGRAAILDSDWRLASQAPGRVTG